MLDLFSGIGGFSMGLERAGMETVAFCEIDPFCRRVLAKHWPEVPCYDDVQTLTASRLVSDGVGRVDVITGGFPCQDISLAGRMRGIDGKKSSMWEELARLVEEARPKFVILENSPVLRSRGLDRILSKFASLGSTTTVMFDDQDVLHVLDDGDGVAPEFAARAFEPFSRGDPHGEGAGLGLSIVSRIALAHGGRAWLADRSSGACFCLQLPLAHDTERSRSV